MSENIQKNYLDPSLVSKLKNMEVKARLIVEGFITGLHKSPYHGYKGTAELSKLEYGSYLAAALHYLMVKQRDATGLITFDQKLQNVLLPKSTQSYLRLLLAKLEKINLATPEQENQKTSAAESLHRIAERVTRRSLIVLVTDLFENVAEHDDLIKALKHLRHRKHEVLVFHVLNSETERAFKFPDVPMLFKDVETGEQISVHPSQMREEYTEAIKHYAF